MGRNHDEGFCCGGGGGRIWMEEHHLRINHQRMDEAIAVNANTVVTACPYCLIMMEDAIKDKEKSETMKAHWIFRRLLRRVFNRLKDSSETYKRMGLPHPFIFKVKTILPCLLLLRGTHLCMSAFSAGLGSTFAVSSTVIASTGHTSAQAPHRAGIFINFCRHLSYLL